MTDLSHTQLLPYTSMWQDKFEDEKQKIQTIFDTKAISIEHIGSTSIPGLISKPIIDIAVMIDHHENADTFTVPLAQLGYQFHLDKSSSERNFYTKGTPIEYHLSIAYQSRGGFWKRQILFRDYLRNHTEARDAYAQLKIKLLQNDPTGVGSYFAGKSEFIADILQKAEK